MKKTLLTFGLLLITILTFGQQTKYVDTEELNIRAGAGTKYEVVDKILQGQKVTVLTEQGKWSEIELENGTKGFVSTKFLSDTETSSSSNKSDKKNSWIGYVLVIGFVLYGLKKLFGGGSSGTSSSPKPASKPYSQPKQTDTFHLSIKDGVVNLGKERSTMRQPVFKYFDKAIDCDLEDPKDDRSRFLVVTAKGEVRLCQLKSTGQTIVFRPFVSYGSAYKARFADSSSFVFTTEKGTYKGYFKSTRIEKLS